MDENGTQLPLNRNKSAYGIVSRLSTDIGSQANFINDAMLDKSSMVRGLAGTPIYSGNSVYGMMTPEQYINSKFGLSVNEANWNSNRVKFERDLIAGNIPNVGVTPTNKVLIEMVFPVMNNSLKNTKRMFQYNTSLIMATTLEKLILKS